jgi:hypothetical protein
MPLTYDLKKGIIIIKIEHTWRLTVVKRWVSCDLHTCLSSHGDSAASAKYLALTAPHLSLFTAHFALYWWAPQSQPRLSSSVRLAFFGNGGAALRELSVRLPFCLQRARKQPIIFRKKKKAHWSSISELPKKIGAPKKRESKKAANH